MIQFKVTWVTQWTVVFFFFLKSIIGTYVQKLNMEENGEGQRPMVNNPMFFKKILTLSISVFTYTFVH